VKTEAWDQKKRGRRASLSFSATVVKNVSSPLKNGCSISYWYVCFPKQGSTFLPEGVLVHADSATGQEKHYHIFSGRKNNQQLILNR